MASSYLKIDDIVGTSKDPGHVNFIELLSWSWGHVNSIGYAEGTRSEGSKVKKPDFHLVKLVDNSSSYFFDRAVTGKKIDKMLFDSVYPVKGAEAQWFLKMTFTNAFVESVSYSGIGSGGSGEAESITLSFEKVTQDYGTQPPQGTTVQPDHRHLIDRQKLKSQAEAENPTDRAA
jgi:type VI secretion system secreted protein Hcp